MRRFLIGSGFHKDPDFAKVWIENLERYVKDLQRVVVISIAGASLPFVRTGLSEINLDGNCGHVGDLLNGKKNYAYTCWCAVHAVLQQLVPNSAQVHSDVRLNVPDVWRSPEQR